MKKVLFTATVDSHILQFHLPFLKLFKEKGYEVHVATNGTEDIPYCDKKHVVSFERSPFKYENIKAIKQLKKIVEEEKFDIIHCHTPMGSVVTRLAAKNERKNGTRVIYTAHGFHFFKGAPLINWMIYYPVEWYLSKYTDTLITINTEDYERAKRKFGKRCKDIQYVPGVGVDPKKFDFEMSEQEKIKIRESLGVKKDDFVLIQVGELNKNKNQIISIKAMKEIIKENPNVKLLLAGTGELEEFYKNKIKEYGLEKNIIMLGYRKDIPQLLKISDVAISTSKREGLPLNLIEAMMAKLPIIATDCRGNRDLLKNENKEFLIRIDDELELVKKIKKIKDNYKIFIFDMKDYSLEDILKKYEMIYFRKKRVLHVLASNKYSGAENVVCTIIENMKDEFDMAYCSPDGSIKEILKERKINFIPLKKLSISQLKKAVNKFNPDIIHAHDFKASCLSSFFNKHHIIISHIHGNNKVMNTKNLKSFLYNVTSKRYKRIIWVSDSALTEYYYNEKVKSKSLVLYNVVDSTQILKKTTEYNCDEEYDLIFLGRLEYPKNPERLIEIVKLVAQEKNNIKVAMVGDGSKRKIIENLIKENNLEKNIKLYGFQSNPYPILNNSKILIMTSEYEGTPMCALEAQALGKPIVSTPTDGLKKIIISNYNGYLLDDNDNFAKSIIDILNNRETYKKMFANSIEFFKNYNNVEKYIKKIKGVYNQ